MRVLGVVLLSLCSLLIGVQAVYELGRRARRYRNCCLFWRDVCNLLQHSRQTPKEIFRLLAEDSRYQSLGFVQGTCRALEDGGRFDTAYLQALAAEEERWGELLPILRQIGRVPGSSNLEAQLEKMHFYCGQLERCTAQAEEEVHERSRLYRALGLAGSAFVFIMLI